MAISCYGSNCTTEIATLPSVARDDAVLRQTLSAQGDLYHFAFINKEILWSMYILRLSQKVYKCHSGYLRSHGERSRTIRQFDLVLRPKYMFTYSFAVARASCP